MASDIISGTLKGMHSKMRIGIILSSIVIIVYCLTWMLFISMYRPTNNDFLVTTTSYYFKRMSETGNNAIASFADCIVEPGSALDRQQGILMFGLCRTENETTVYHYSIAMSPTAGYVYADLEEQKNGG